MDGGDVVVHSSVPAYQGLFPAGAPVRLLAQTFHMKTTTDIAISTAPNVSSAFVLPQFMSSGYQYMRRGMPRMPRVCVGQNVRLKPKKNSQKCHFPSRSSNMRPVIFGNQ